MAGFILEPFRRCRPFAKNRMTGSGGEFAGKSSGSADFVFADVLAFQLYYRLFQQARDSRWEKRALEQLKSLSRSQSFRADSSHRNPNSDEALDFIRTLSHIMIARCKTL